MKRILMAVLVSLAAAAVAAQDAPATTRPVPVQSGPPTELKLQRAKGGAAIDLRRLPATPPRRRDRPEREEPEVNPVEIDHDLPLFGTPPAAPAAMVPMPPPISNFLGLDYANWGAGRPPDTVGDVGPQYFIQAVNTSIGIYRKSDSVRVAAFTFDTFMSQGNFGNLCDTDNYGDPVVLYDSFEDRWVITDFAFQLDQSGNVINPPGAYQCFAVSQSGDPVAGGWNFYSIHITDFLNDYPKFGIWPDGIYMTANMFGFPASGGFVGTRVWSLNKAQMYAGNPTVQVVQFNPPTSEFTLIPANARLQAGTPPSGRPNYVAVVWNFTNAISFYKFHVDWANTASSTFTGPFTALAPASWITAPSTVPAKNGNNNDTLRRRLMMQNQYTSIGAVESLWTTHTVAGASTSVAAVRYYQTTVTGGVVAANTTQAATHAPDTTNRYMPSVAVDRAGDMAIGYSVSSSTVFPALRYAGRLAGDPLNTLPQTETSLVEGTGSQNTSTRWGDYSTMTLDPDGCTFWFTSEYYITTGNNWQTRVGSFKFPSCTPLSTGTLQGTVSDAVGGAPVSGATVTLGSRVATTDGTGFFSFANIAPGTYPGMTVTAAGFDPASLSSVIVNDGGTTIQNFALNETCLPTPTITPGQPQVCPGSTGNTASGPAGLATYSWSIVSGSITGGAASQIVTYTAGASGTVGLTLIVTDGAGCQVSGSANVPIVAVPVPTINAGGPTTFCAGGSVVLTSSSATGNQWYRDGATLAGQTAPTYTATTSGSYTVIVTTTGCVSPASSPTVVTVNPIPPAPSITAGGATTFCQGGSVALTSSSATGNQWYRNGTAIGGAAGVTYNATTSGNYTVRVTASGCQSPASPATAVTVNPTPPTPTISAGGATTFCEGGSVTLTSSSATGNQWYLNGSPIGAATNQTFNATASGNYTVVVTALGCPSAASAATTVTSVPTPALPAITAPEFVVVGATDGTATVAAHAGNTYAWTLTGGTITSGQGSSSIVYSAGAPGTRMTLSVVETAGPGCASAAASSRVMVDFLDVPPSHPFHAFVIRLARNGITGGCGGGNFCPNEGTLRSQMAVFLLRGEHGQSFAPPAATGIFADVTVPSFFADFIEQLYNEGISGGCGTAPLRYCPADSVLRSQMAIFLLRAEHGSAYVPPPATGIFADVPTDSFGAPFIEQLYAEGITGGCATSPLRYCPSDATTRGSMAVFLSRTFSLP